ncbi:MFS transporter [Bacillus sp. FJAT-25509]|uniref:SLC45 family MFS transporter n=1 Tax=Bacillus sp. FJAT-25509 TaxID=1712029 RepID=UPI0006FC2DDA|nr:SLC45 family MFS transporter [Bacillus sp. FJAT-25509]KQL33778.1 MFS transporter [Bacillus sp. FJAT-25509]
MTKLNYKKIMLLGFGFFAISLTWSVYNAFMPKLLSDYIKSSALIGFIMTFDNYFALFLQPAVGMYSDRLDTRFGRRMPFLMIGMPLAAIFTFLIPVHKTLFMLIFFIVFMNLSMSIFRSPVIALMPDLTRVEQRSKANSVINFMGGIGALIAFFIGSILWDLNKGFPFYLAGFLMLVSFLILFFFIREKRDVLNYEQAEEKVKLREGFRSAIQNKSVLFLLLAILSWFTGFNGIETFFTRYGEVYLGVKVSAAAFSFAFISLAFLIFAIPAGFIGTKIGKKRSILIGIFGIMIGFIVLFFLKDLLYIRIVFLVMGCFWALVNINSYPFLAEMAPIGFIGTFTGLYYLFSSIANIISPPFLGAIMDLIGFKFMFLYGFFFITVSFFMMLKVKDNHKTVEKNSNASI